MTYNIEFSCSAEPSNPGVGRPYGSPTQTTKVPLSAATTCYVVDHANRSLGRER
jgi:hypothetical protein